MKKIYYIYIAIATVAIMGNWRIEEKEKDLTNGTGLNEMTVTSNFQASIMILIAAIIIVTFLRKLKKTKSEKKIIYYHILLLIPILVNAPKYTTRKDLWIEDGIMNTWIFRFPVENNLFLFGLASILMIIVQRLTKDKSEQVGSHNSGKRSALTSA